MIVEVLFNEVCGLNGDAQNAAYLQATLPNATFIYTDITQEPYFATARPDMILIGYMTEATQRRVIQKLMPLKDRIAELVDDGVAILATSNAGEIFCRHISYETEKIEMDGLGIFDLEVKTHLFRRYNGKYLGKVAGITLVGFRTQFGMIYGDNSQCYFAKMERGIGINKSSSLEGMRKNNLICTALVGPIFPLNPLFCEYFIGLTGVEATAAHRDIALEAYKARLCEYRKPEMQFDV